MIIADLADEQEHLKELYEGATDCIPVLLDNDEGLPLSEIYAPLLIEEDLDAMKRTRRPDEPSGSKELDSVEDVFYVGYKLSTRILMKGEAGSGKSVFCLKLVENWSQLKHGHVCEKHSALMWNLCTTCEMQECLSEFDLLYYVPLRDASEGKTSVVDLICDAVCNDCPEEMDRTKRLLSNKNVRCLIVLDGVDEWPHPPGFTGLPTSRGLSMKCVMLWTMRPWKLVQLQLKPKHDDHIVTVSGLTPYGVDTVIENILERFYGLKGETLKSTLLAYREKIEEDEALEGIMRMPMMLIAACHIWQREDASGLNKSLDTKQSFSVTHLYLELIDQMIQNAAKKQRKQSSFVQTPPTSLVSDDITIPSTQPSLPNILKKFQYIRHCIDMLLPFCELAHTDLISAETKLVFNIGQLERQLGKSHVDLARRLGLISQAKVRGKYPQPNVCVSFYHKSVQELLAAMYMTCGPPDALTSFCQYCSTLEKVTETADITKFLFGLHPALGSRLCEHIANIVNSDPDITQYRRTLDYHSTGSRRVEQLYYRQCEWYKEMTQSRTVTGDTSPPPSLHVTDIYLLDDYEVRLKEDLMYSHLDTIVSVQLWGGDISLDGMVQCFPQCPHLTALCIEFMDNTVNFAQTVAMIPRLTQLHTVRYRGKIDAGVCHVQVVAAVLQLTQLRYIHLEHVRLGEDVLVLTADWTRLQSVMFVCVYMSDRSWERFLSSLLAVQHPVDVTLCYTDIDADRVRWLQTSPHFTGVGDYNRRGDFTFTTVPPDTQ